jgi:hypothetical protein
MPVVGANIAVDARNVSRYNKDMTNRAINPSQSRLARERCAERHRWRQLLKTEAGVRPWIQAANDTLNVLMAGMPDHVIAAVRVEVGQLGSEIQTMVQRALDRRELPGDLAAQIYAVVCERQRAAAHEQPCCATCGHASSEHSTVVDAWCYECRGACCYVQSVVACSPHA